MAGAGLGTILLKVKTCGFYLANSFIDIALVDIDDLAVGVVDIDLGVGTCSGSLTHSTSG